MRCEGFSEEEIMRALTAWLAGLTTGYVLARALDPVQGRRRRAMLRDQAVHAAHTVDDAVTVTVRDAPADVPGLQGQPRGGPGRFELWQEHWSPTARVFTGAAGAAAALVGLR